MREYTNGELNRPTVTHFATNFLSLQNLLNEYQALRRMFCTREWLHYKDNTKPNAIAVNLSFVKDSLWEKVIEVVNMTETLKKVLKIMDGDKPPLGYVYEGMDRAI